MFPAPRSRAGIRGVATMRYFFDIRTARGITPDPDGQILASDDASVSAARAEALGIAADHLRDGSPVSVEAIIIRNEHGRTIAEVDVGSVVKGYLR